MSLELQLIRASEFIRLSADGQLDLRTTKLALARIARACHKRGIPRAMLDLRNFQPGPQPALTPSDLTTLVDTFCEIGFSKEQRLAVLYTSDPHRRARLFSFICLMHGWQVKGFGNFEKAMLWLSQETSDARPEIQEEYIPIRKPLAPLKFKVKS